ncbi:MAG: GNAT superfamily N-acetyltransferase [Pseudomonadales bacterium]|jgi:GNAT superfamily N-acetyltransferase
MSETIEAVNENNLSELLPLMRQYQQFYQIVDICDERNRNFFAQFGLANPFGCQFLYCQDREVLGFATVYFTYTSTIAAKVAVMNDLFTLENARGKGIGRKLIEHCRQYAKDRGAARLQWITGEDNTAAQSLYDNLDTASRNWKFYTYPVIQDN